MNGLQVLDVGSGDINGNNREFFDKTCNYKGNDVFPGRNVDLVYKTKDLPFFKPTFHTIISKVHDSQSIIVYFNGKTDILNIDLTGETSTSTSTSVNKDYNKYFKIPLVEFENDIMDVPSADYEAEFTIIAKKICEITNQMLLFGTDIHFKCSEEQIDLVTNGVTGEMLVKIPIEDLNEYSVIEDEVVDIKYSLAYVDKMCLTNKLSNEIQFCISRDFPMKIKYDLGDDSSLVFYIAPMVHE
jgi:hypothetical protein